MINCMSTFLTALCNQKQEEKQKRKNIWMKIRLHFSKNVFNSFEKQSWKLFSNFILFLNVQTQHSLMLSLLAILELFSIF